MHRQQVVTQVGLKAAQDKRPMEGLFGPPYTVIDCPGQNTRNSGRQRLPDSGKTHCNWVSPRLQLYFWNWRERGWR